MLNLRPLDAACPIEQQLQNSATPVVLVNLFTVDEADTPALMVADFVSAMASYPSSAVAQPHLFVRVAVPNLCAA